MKKLTIEDIRNRFLEQGWVVEEERYLGSQIPLRVICPHDHRTQISWNNFQKKQGCKYCAGNAVYEIEKVQFAFEEAGCKLLSSQYANNYSLLDYRCVCGLESKICFRDFLRGVRCTSCKSNRLSEIKRISPDRIRSFCQQHGFELISHWVEGKKTKVEIKCHCNKKSILFWNQLRNNSNCRHLRKRKSETIRVGRRKNLGVVKRSYQQWLYSWGQPNSTIVLADPKNFIRQSSSQNLVVSLGEQNYLIAFMHEWHKRQVQWTNHLLSMCGVYDTRIYARKCQVKEISGDTVRSFCEQYHIQGKNRLSIQGWGLFHDKELLGVISLGRHHRNKGDLVLDRLCFKAGVQVIGGADKLFRRCVSWAKTAGHQSIVSFSDNRYSRGGIYEKLGFTLDSDMPADYFYVLKSDVLVYFSKQSQRKKVSGCPPELTEHQWATQRGLLRVWDCGKKRWVFQLGGG